MVRVPGRDDRPGVVHGGVEGQLRPSPGGTAVGGFALENLTFLRGEFHIGGRVDVGGDVDGFRIVRVDAAEAGVVLLAGVEELADAAELGGGPGAAIEAAVENPVIAGSGVAIHHGVAVAAGEEDHRALVGIVFQLGGPAMVQRGGGNTLGLPDLGEGLRCRAGVVINVGVDFHAVAVVAFPALDVAVIDAVVVVARMGLGADEIDTVHAVAEELVVAVRVAEAARLGRKAAAVGPGVALVVRITEMRVAVLAAGEVVEASLAAAFGGHEQQVRIRDISRAAPVEGEFRVPGGVVVRVGGNPDARVARGVEVVAIRDQIAAVRALPDGADVVVVPIAAAERQIGLDETLARTGGGVEGNRVDIAIARLAAVAEVVRGGGEEDVSRDRIAERALVLIPAPAAVVVEQDHVS